MDDETQTTGDVAPAQAETANAQASEADVQTNNDAPEAPSEVKESDVKATETAEEKLYAGKYKTVEELEKAYTSANSEASKMSQEKAELTRILNDAFASPEPVAQETEEDVYAESPTSNPEFEKIKQDNAIIKFALAHQDADGEAMNKIIATDPMISQITGPEAKLEYAYLQSKNMSQPKAIEEAKKEGQVQAQVKIAEKQTAQVETSRKAEKLDEGNDLRAIATGNYTQEERDAARRAFIKQTGGLI